MMQKQLSGELIEWNPKTRLLHIRFRKWWETGRYRDATASFLLDPYAIVTSAYRGTLRLSELIPSQRVTLTYVTGADGHPIAKTVTVSTKSGVVRKPLALS